MLNAYVIYSLDMKMYFYEYILCPILRIVLEPFSLKKSYWWHWVFYYKRIPERFIKNIDGDPEAKPRDGFVSSFWQTNFGWKKIALLKCVDIYVGEIRYGFIDSNDRVKICTYSQDSSSKIALLVGPESLRFFAIRADTGYPVMISLLSESLTKRHCKAKSAILL